MTATTTFSATATTATTAITAATTLHHNHGIQVSLNPNLYENPGDFIIDALDLSGVQDEFEDFEEKKVRKPILGPINQR